jgi:endonuclease YncB( thermonuclease family)
MAYDFSAELWRGGCAALARSEPAQVSPKRCCDAMVVSALTRPVKKRKHPRQFHTKYLPASLLLSVAMLFASPCAADVRGKVVGVQDGDTLTVLDESRVQHRIRLSDIDAPEKPQPFGQRSKTGLSDCAFGQHVTILGHKIDRYNRLVGKVTTQASVDWNLRQLELGLNWA